MLLDFQYLLGNLEAHLCLVFVTKATHRIAYKFLTDESQKWGIDIKSTQLDSKVDTLAYDVLAVVQNLLLDVLVVVFLLLGTCVSFWHVLSLVKLLRLELQENLVNEALNAWPVSLQ